MGTRFWEISFLRNQLTDASALNQGSVIFNAKMGDENLAGKGDSNLELSKYTIPIPEVINVQPKNSNSEDVTGKYFMCNNKYISDYFVGTKMFLLINNYIFSNGTCRLI